MLRSLARWGVMLGLGAGLAGCDHELPPPKMSWDEAVREPVTPEASLAAAQAGQVVPDAEEVGEGFVPASEEQARAELLKLSPLGQSTLRFDGVEQVLRTRFAHTAMPADALRAWSGLFAAIDQSVDGELPTTHLDLVRARLAVQAELEQDRHTYKALPTGLEEAVVARLRALSARLKGKLQARAGPTALAWPLSPVVVTSQFGVREDPLSPGRWQRHQGVDLEAPKGQLVTAAAAGTVELSGWNAGYGLMVELRHPDGTTTRYGHLSQLLTRKGLEVERGGAVGLVGSTGRSTGPHLHFEVWRDGQVVDPLSELGDPEPGDESP